MSGTSRDDGEKDRIGHRHHAGRPVHSAALETTHPVATVHPFADPVAQHRGAQDRADAGIARTKETSASGADDNSGGQAWNGFPALNAEPETSAADAAVASPAPAVRVLAASVAENGAADTVAPTDNVATTSGATTGSAASNGTETAPAATVAATAASFFNVGDLVISVYGDGDNSGTYADNQAAPIVLEELTTSGTFVRQMVLPQTTQVVNGVTEWAVSGEYGSSSEGTLELSADGRSLVIAGYAINAATYNAGGAAVYGNAALAQSTSVQGGQYTAVARVIADIGADGSVDSSTALYNIANTNNPRSVATVDGSTFYISGQGVKGDTTQGVFEAADGASSATAIDTSTDTRTVEISNGTLYVSRDSKQGNTSSISSYGDLPQGSTAATTLPGLSGTVKLTAAQTNTINSSAVGTKVNLSPENFFFANSTTLYVADSGEPKTGSGLGDGGLQKWTLSGGTWTLDYTLSQGLNLVSNSSSAGTTGLIGLTGAVNGNSVTLYATNATIGDLDQTYLYGITDTLSATTNPNESFTTLATAAAGTNIRGVAFAPSAAGDAPCFASGTMILTDRGERPVEKLRAGDIVLVPDGSGFRSAPIRWVGSRRVRIDRHADPERVRPIRFAPDAIAPGIPSRPLFVSPDHALLLDGVLVAARALCNGLSIAAWPVEQVTYHHVELDRHDILLADNVRAESYLDTGNRHQFAGGGTVALHPAFDRGTHPGACARLATDAATVEPIHRRLAERAGVVAAAIAVTRDPALAMVLPDGREIAPMRVGADGCHSFMLPEAAGNAPVLLRSRAQSPACLRPWLDDRRRLGVGVGAIVAWTPEGGLEPIALQPGDGPGWWPACDGDPVRWTDGAAFLALPAGCVRVDVIVAATMEYEAAA